MHFLNESVKGYVIELMLESERAEGAYIKAGEVPPGEKI